MIYKYIVIANGIYDIFCGFVILKKHRHEPHLNMFIIQLNPDARRFLAYWIITYGVVRLIADLRIASITYIMEAAMFEYERTQSKLIPYKVSFVTIACVIMSICCIL